MKINLDILIELSKKINFINKHNHILNKHICSVCTIREIDTVYTNCGHTFCSECTSKIMRN